jgi:hypothetical protein
MLKMYWVMLTKAERNQVGAPTVPSAFIGRSGEVSQSWRILVALDLVTMSCNSCHFMQIHVINGN